jgi:hypothetical protein
MYKLSLKKVNKRTRPNFIISFNQGSLCLYTDKLSDLKNVMIKIYQIHKNLKDKITQEKSNKYHIKNMESFVIEDNLNQNFSFKLNVKGVKKEKKIEVVLSDEALDKYIKELIIKEDESYFDFLDNSLRNDDYYNEYLYNNDNIFNKELLELELELNNPKRMKDSFNKQILKNKKEILKNKENYRKRKEVEIYYEYTISDLLFNVKYYDEDSIEYNVEIKELKEVLLDF